jgi:2-polyprenyl-3-methyl-5-hydroxy-6-metoxy-1,4-benzoquinol methylase
LDLSGVAIELAKRRCPDSTFICVSLEEAVLPKFDVVMVLGVLEHFEDYVGIFAKLRMIMNGILYVEVPNCIAYPSSEKIEGFRRLNQGSHQMEWHLYRETWEKRLISEFKIIKSIIGPNIYSEFIWLLK